MPFRSSRTPAAAARRGALLLIVLLILSLFLVIGAVAILLAIRARESARAFASATMPQAGSAAVARAQLDASLIKLIRGPSASGVAGGDVSESLLEDKYGTSQTGTATAATAAGPLLQVTVTGLDTSNPATIAGRVLTFVPAAGDPTAPSSYRILRTGTVANTLLLANVKQATPMPLPTIFPCEVVVNGREFATEAYDAFDANNAFLTNSGTLVNSRVQQVVRPAFGTTSGTCTVDNDGDGVLDGIWLTGVLPAQRTADGSQLSFAVSYLVLDLDGRVNLNAHGTFARAQVQRGSPPYPLGQTGFVGMGYGPADVIAPLVVATTAEASSGTIPARWPLLLQGGTVTRNAVVSSTTQWRPTPMAETTQPGRYGADAVPGATAIVTATNPLNPDAWIGGNSPSDLKGQLQVYTDPATSPPTLTFFRPQSTWASPDTDDAFGTGAAAHPYRLRLDDDAPRGAASAAADAPYTLAELERILRPFDSDAAQLAPRLAAILDDRAERSRMIVTTDSWDTPAIAGAAMTPIITYSGSMSDPYAVFSPETVAGLRFNLNRPILGSGTATDRQDYFRQLYTLVVAQTGTANADAAAQWVANVIEFRDTDSIMTWYPYDTNPLDGTWTTGTGVWGVERPEVVITSASNQTTSSRTGTITTVLFSLHRPWKASCTSTSGSAIPTELIDDCLGDRAANTLRLTGSSAASDAKPIWQLTIQLSGSSTTQKLASLITTATAVQTNTTVTGSWTSPSSSATRVTLQRLANPKAVLDTNSANPTYNDYVTVDSVSFTTGTSRMPSRWLHWPNRDLVSHGELLAVQTGSAAKLAEVLFDGSKEASLARTFPAILDATIVPSRYVGTNVSVASGSTWLAGTRYENFQYGQLSRWREPGRVNVNTILPNTGNTDMVDDAVWNALIQQFGPTNPASPSSPIQTDKDLLVTGSDARFPLSGPNNNSGFLQRRWAVQLANAATIRSNVFAVWITLKITDSSPNAGPPRFARLFAIVDRSIPVGYAPGRPLNARDTIRLVRYLE